MIVPRVILNYNAQGHFFKKKRCSVCFKEISIAWDVFF